MTSCCKGCTRRKQGCHVGCEQAAVEDIVKIIAYADKLNGLQTAIDLTDRKQAEEWNREIASIVEEANTLTGEILKDA